MLRPRPGPNLVIDIPPAWLLATRRGIAELFLAPPQKAAALMLANGLELGEGPVPWIESTTIRPPDAANSRVAAKLTWRVEGRTLITIPVLVLGQLRVGVTLYNRDALLWSGWPRIAVPFARTALAWVLDGVGQVGLE